MALGITWQALIAREASIVVQRQGRRRTRQGENHARVQRSKYVFESCLLPTIARESRIARTTIAHASSNERSPDVRAATCHPPPLGIRIRLAHSSLAHPDRNRTATRSREQLTLPPRPNSVRGLSCTGENEESSGAPSQCLARFRGPGSKMCPARKMPSEPLYNLTIPLGDITREHARNVRTQRSERQRTTEDVRHRRSSRQQAKYFMAVCAGWSSGRTAASHAAFEPGNECRQFTQHHDPRSGRGESVIAQLARPRRCIRQVLINRFDALHKLQANRHVDRYDTASGQQFRVPVPATPFSGQLTLDLWSSAVGCHRETTKRGW